MPVLSGPRQAAMRTGASVLGCALLASWACAGPTAEQRALELLVHAFAPKGLKNIRAVITMPVNSTDQTQTAEVVISTDGRQRVTVLQPLQRSGIVILVLGATTQVYDRDRNTLTISQTPSAPFDSSERLKLIRANYHLKMNPRASVAGRICTCVTAVSKYKPLGGAKIYVDPSSYYVMRIETIAPSGATSMRFNTKLVEYPASIPEELFRIRAAAGVVTETHALPTAVRSAAAARKLAGFTPAVPAKLPFGFVVRKLYVQTDGGAKTVGVDVSDGLAAATVFEQAAASASREFREGLAEGRPGFLRSGAAILNIYTSAGPEASKRLLEAFARRAALLLGEPGRASCSGTACRLARVDFTKRKREAPPGAAQLTTRGQ